MQSKQWVGVTVNPATPMRHMHDETPVPMTVDAELDHPLTLQPRAARFRWLATFRCPQCQTRVVGEVEVQVSAEARPDDVEFAWFHGRGPGG